MEKGGKFMPDMSQRIAIDDKSYIDSGYIRLPYKGDQFKDFINSLLGEPQSLEGKVVGDFSITITNLETLHYLIQQRIQSQNNGHLIQFIVKILFNDKSMVTLNSLNEFITYNELKQVVPVKIFLNWTYLIQFPDKEYPEKQNISVSFITGEGYRKFQVDYLFFKLSEDSASSSGVAEYKIAHTSRSWGIDIESLIINSINSMMEKRSKLSNFIAQKNTLLSFISSFGITALFFTFGKKYIEHEKSSQLSIVNCDLSKLGDNLNGKLDYLINYIASNDLTSNSNNLFILLILCLPLFLLISILIRFGLSITSGSYILLTNEAKKQKIADDKKIRRKLIMSILTIITSIATGVIGNYAYTYLITK